MSNEIVRKQLAGTIKRKEAQARKLGRQEETLRRDAAALARKRGALEAETEELTKHLTKLGGPVEVKEK